MTSDFDRILSEHTKKGEATVQGVLIKCVDKNGKELYSKIAGYNSLSDDATPLREDATLKLGSATKLITSIALLQCIDEGLIGLDESLNHILPELKDKEILEGVEGATPITRPNTVAITPRHLLAHMSGLGYWFIHPLLMKWRATSALKDSPVLTERFDYPLVFEPSQGWLYGCNLDWAGVVVSRLHGGAITLEEYMIENIWKRVGRTAPFPTFHVEKHPEYEARLMQSAERTPAGGLAATGGQAFCLHLDADEGGAGLTVTMADYLAVLQDLVSDAPRLLRPETIAKMLEPQIPSDSPALPMLLQLRPAWDIVSGPVRGEDVNHGLGGLLLLGETPEIAQPKGILCWGGSPNIVWFISRDLGVAGFFGTQMSPFGDETVKKVVNAWKKDFWSQFKASSSVDI